MVKIYCEDCIETMKNGHMPDNTYEYFDSKEDYLEALKGIEEKEVD